MTWLEAFAAIFGVICVWLTIRQNIWCWPTGLIQVILYIFIFYNVRLYSDLILHIFYVVMQIYGWYYWLHGGKNKMELLVTNQSYLCLSGWITSGLLITVLWGFLMQKYTNASVPYADAFTTVMSLIAQWLMARKKLESWYFWISVDVIAIGVYFYKKLYITTGLYAIFLVLATMGYFAWKKSFDENVVLLNTEKCKA